MSTQHGIRRRLVLPAAALLLAMFAGALPSHSQPSAPSRAKQIAAPAADLSEADSAAIQNQLLKLLRLSPTLTSVVARDPSLLADQDYVNRSNPELAQFLQAHPEVARNPSFYLFSHLNQGRGGRNDEALERAVWPDLVPAPVERGNSFDYVGPIAAALGFACILGSLLWLIRMLMENRRWSRIFKLQTEVHTKLIDRFGNNQELLTYMDTEAGRRFLEAAPIPVDFDRNQQQFPGAVSRVLMPLQIGIVLTLLGIGLLFLRSVLSRGTEALSDIRRCRADARPWVYHLRRNHLASGPASRLHAEGSKPAHQRKRAAVTCDAAPHRQGAQRYELGTRHTEGGDRRSRRACRAAHG